MMINYSILLTISLTILFSFLSAKEKVRETEKFPVPFLQKVEGWPVEWNPTFKQKENNRLFQDVRKALANHLQRVVYILDKNRVQQLRKLVIRVDLNHKLGNIQYHPNKAWLINNHHDPSLEKRVHIPRAGQLLSKAQWAKHPYVILHELAHSFHDQVLSFENKEIISSIVSILSAFRLAARLRLTMAIFVSASTIIFLNLDTGSCICISETFR